MFDIQRLRRDATGISTVSMHSHERSMNIEYYNVQFDFECKWSANEKKHNLDRPWMCQMPFIIGYTAVIIALAIMSVTFHRYDLDLITSSNSSVLFHLFDNTHMNKFHDPRQLIHLTQLSMTSMHRYYYNVAMALVPNTCSSQSVAGGGGLDGNHGRLIVRNY